MALGCNESAVLSRSMFVTFTQGAHGRDFDTYARVALHVGKEMTLVSARVQIQLFAVFVDIHEGNNVGRAVPYYLSFM